MGLACSDGEPAGPSESTWYKDVLPIARERCFGCHTEGGVGSFAMDVDASDDESYENLRKAARYMVLAVDGGHMPPWPPDPACRSYRGQRVLDESEKLAFRRWQEQGAPRGNPNDAPAPRVPAALPRVDLSLGGVSYLPASENGTDIQCFVLDPALSAPAELAGLRVLPGSGRVHDALVYAAERAAAEAADAADPAPGYDCFGPPDGASLIGSWMPSAPPLVYPRTLGFRLEPETLFVLQINYDLASGEPEQDATGLELMFVDSARERAIPRRLSAADFVLPPMSRNQTAEASVTFSESGTVWGVAAALGMRGTAVDVRLSGSGGDRCLLAVPIYQFGWQELYFVSEPGGVPFGAGDSLTVSCTWDNSSIDEIRAGQSATDERCVSELLTTVP